HVVVENLVVEGARSAHRLGSWLDGKARTPAACRRRAEISRCVRAVRLRRARRSATAGACGPAARSACRRDFQTALPCPADSNLLPFQQSARLASGTAPGTTLGMTAEIHRLADPAVLELPANAAEGASRPPACGRQASCAAS